MRIKINPTRMQLLRLRRRVELARRGHKLLKDKLDGLVQRFFGIKNDFLALHKKLEPRLSVIFLKAIASSALSQPEAQTGRAAATVEVSHRSIMGVRIPSYRLDIEGKPSYNELTATSETGEAVNAFSEILPELVQLASLSRALRLIATQIIETRRRVNALEYILIPELERNLKFIRMKLSELERGTRVVLLKLEG